MLLAKAEYQRGLILELRQKLHALAEPSMSEYKTKALLMEFLRQHTSLELVDCGSWFYAYHAGAGGTGEQGAIALRADFDAVVCEDGCARHLCGHDGHSAILAGVALALESLKISRDVYFIFQPGEETGQGAALCSQLLVEHDIKEVYGMHNIPGFAENEVLLAEGTFACASTGMELVFEGAPAHAAYPEQGKNPALLIAEIITYLQQLIAEPHGGVFLGTVIGVDLGSKSYGLAAEKGVLCLTLRAELQDEYDALVESIKKKALQGAAAQGMQCSIKYIEPFPATVNNKSCVEKVQQAAELVGLKTSFLQEPMRWSEDFGYYLQKAPGAFFGMGCGKQHAGLHTAAYEFNDAVIDAAVALFLQLAKS
ncbi:MAG: M20 family metallopeptidase [Phascolarctobacterium sp.]